MVRRRERSKKRKRKYIHRIRLYRNVSLICMRILKIQVGQRILSPRNHSIGIVFFLLFCVYVHFRFRSPSLNSIPPHPSLKRVFLPLCRHLLLPSCDQVSPPISQKFFWIRHKPHSLCQQTLNIELDFSFFFLPTLYLCTLSFLYSLFCTLFFIPGTKLTQFSAAIQSDPVFFFILLHLILPRKTKPEKPFKVLYPKKAQNVRKKSWKSSSNSFLSTSFFLILL